MCLTIYTLLAGCLWILPVFTVIWVLSAFGISYGIAVGLNHTGAVFPYISKTGTDVPERGVFTAMVTITALAMAMNAEIRFQYVRLVMGQMSLTPKEKRRWMSANSLALYLSIVAAIGLLLVASFQVDVMNVPHYLGAFCTFVFGVIACWIHCAITYKLYKEERVTEYIVTSIFQIIISFISSVLFFTFCGTFGAYRHKRDAGLGTKEGALREIYLSASISEWLLAISVVAFVLTFIPGFRKMEYDGINVKWKSPGSSSKTGICERACSCCQ